MGAALVLAALATGCSGSSTPAPTPTPNAATRSSASPPAADASAARVLQRAVTKTEALSEFTFTASTTVAAKQTVRTSITGRVIRGRGIAYALAVGNKKTQVVRIRGATYVRSVPGKWSKLATPKSVVNPTSTLLALLKELTPTAASRSSGNTRIVGVLAATAAKSVGIPAIGTPATAVVLLDHQGRAIAVTLRGTTTAGSHVVHLSVISRYSHFGHVQPIRRP